MWDDFLKKLRVRRLCVYRGCMNKMIKLLYKTKHNENQKEQTNEAISIDKNDLFETSKSQRHRHYYGFVENRVATRSGQVGSGR